MGNRVSVELGQNITYSELDKGDIVTVNDNVYLVAHLGKLEFQLINIATGHNRYDTHYSLDELVKMIKQESANRRIRYFKNSIMRLDVGREFIPYT